MSTTSSIPLFENIEVPLDNTLSSTETLLSLSLRSRSYTDLDIDVLKTNGELRIHIGKYDV